MSVMSMQELFYGETPEPSYFSQTLIQGAQQSYVGMPDQVRHHQVAAGQDFTMPLLWPRISNYCIHRYQSPSSGNYCALQERHIGEEESYADGCNVRASSTYSRSHCPTYRHCTGTTHYVSVGRSSFATPTH